MERTGLGMGRCVVVAVAVIVEWYMSIVVVIWYGNAGCCSIWTGRTVVMVVLAVELSSDIGMESGNEAVVSRTFSAH